MSLKLKLWQLYQWTNLVATIIRNICQPPQIHIISINGQTAIRLLQTQNHITIKTDTNRGAVTLKEGVLTLFTLLGHNLQILTIFINNCQISF